VCPLLGVWEVDWEVEMGPAGSSICCDVLANELVRLICLNQKSSKSLTLATNSVSNLVFAIIEPVSHACY
jgi:hypothetical protein